MKILELRFKNLNSLYGEWRIDFTDPEYDANGIFALTGPTGAGKSTILDAVCLALYGATPRLGRITKSGNEIMSRQTGECYSEVLFESQAGRFRCHWEQRRARKRAEGKLQDQEHQIADDVTGKPIETKKSLVAGVIEEKTGMDFDRFTRSILLAQGGFDTFLRADVEEKSRILEQITGTEVYSEISRRTHERQRDEREKLRLLQAETSGIVILEPEKEVEIKESLEAGQRREAELAAGSARINKAIEWLAAIDGLKKEIDLLNEEAEKLRGDTEAFKPEYEKLEWATKAAALEGIHATLAALRRQQSDDQSSLETGQEDLPELASSVRKQAELLKSAEQQTLKAKEDLREAAPLIRRIRSLDQTITEQKKAALELKDGCNREAEKIGSAKRALLGEKERRAEADGVRQVAGRYLEEHSQDEWLVSGLAGIEEQFSNLLGRQEEIVLKEADEKNAVAALGQATRILDESREQLHIRTRELEEATKQLRHGRDLLDKHLEGRHLREYRTEKESLLRERACIRKIEELEAYRANLEDGKPCPLCGSKVHPFAAGNVPVPDAIEQRIQALEKLIGEAEDLEAANKKLEEAESVARTQLANSEKLKSSAAKDKQNYEELLDRLRSDLEKLRGGFEELKQSVSARLQPFGIKEIKEKQPSSILDSLKNRLNKWQEEAGKMDEVEKQIAEIDGEIKRLNAVIETQSTALQEKQAALERLEEELADGTSKRKNLYGDKNPDDEEGSLNRAVSDAEEAEKNARILSTELQQRLTSAKTDIESLRRRLAQRQPELEKAEADFSSGLEQAEFSDEKQFLAARLTNEERIDLSSRAQEIENARTDLKARQKDRETRLKEEKAKKVTDKSRDELEQKSKEYEGSLQELRDAVAALKHKLSENSAAKERIKEKQAVMDIQKKECLRWDNLHSLIGSADGKKYRNFAQGLTFELMVSHANQQLEKMTDRYLLIRDDENPLELNVVDNYQAGEIRSTRNLSGGESFIVSLSLALGLSRMASRKVRVDSLFLDEGFGTLDEESLETALETLSGLQQDGKLIGIISHVSPLRERIRTQVTVTPVSGGKSELSGPGCRKIGGPAG